MNNLGHLIRVICLEAPEQGAHASPGSPSFSALSQLSFVMLLLPYKYSLPTLLALNLNLVN